MANGEIDTIRKIVLIIPKASDHQGHKLGDVSNVIRIVPPRRNLYAGETGGGLGTMVKNFSSQLPILPFYNFRDKNGHKTPKNQKSHE